jgi:hypothetical protein
MKVFNMIKFIGSKNPKYKLENIINDLPFKPVEGKGYLDNNGNRQGLWEKSETVPLMPTGSNGKISKGLFKDDKKEGVWESYYNGELKRKGSYKDGKKNGYYLIYGKNGGLWEKISYKNDIQDGICEWYYDNGQLKRKDLFKDGKMNGISESYYEDGTLKEKGGHVNGKMDGYWEFYNEDGGLKDRILFNKDDKWNLLKIP